ncbi:acetate/propionate family kinase [Chlorobaculum sp. MV4-Y]|uniref:acetate/propionate family kinase n=1 Tax=Chlorobaculum sp. MV4-Y TaxID=2976335 RepID=UPI0021AF6E1D|nr:acetate/propionate family kinase [Chlorobaculum sp. MV4-Y]UWX56844.1 acetate/propionate family kinase [Chlorobaculum sp. MV4-Y]
MMPRPVCTILALNTGSSSIKFSLYESGTHEELLFSGSLTRIGLPDGRFSVTDPDGRFIDCERVDVPDHAAACRYVFSWITQHGPGIPDAVGHRVVHGGPRHITPEKVTPELLDSIAELVPYAPEHLPQALNAIRYAASELPGVFQVACFDTAFHSTMPPLAKLCPIPEEYRNQGVQRYGFHGLSYQYILSQLQAEGDLLARKGRVILAHLGHGASMAAVLDGRSVETTMGFSPAGGLVMSTRTGDLDPGVVLFLLQQGHLDSAGLRDMVNKKSGLFGLSGLSDDMRDLLDAESKNEQARLAVELFCYSARKHIGALTAALGGLDMIVFTGGIGFHSPEIRERVSAGLEFLGVQVDHEKNLNHSKIISTDASPVVVKVIETNEEVTIVRETRRVLEGG